VARLTASANQSHLAIVDVQEKLCRIMPEADMQAVIKHCGILLQAANLLEVPATITEQYPDGLGPTEPHLAQFIGTTRPIAKTVFSACAAPAFKARLQRDQSQIVLAGIEAHICVLQTALDLLALGKQVFVVEDAIISRNPDHKRNALMRLSDAGCIIINTESVVFEWLGNAAHPAFKEIAKLIK